MGERISREERYLVVGPEEKIRKRRRGGRKAIKAQKNFCTLQKKVT